MVERTSDPGEPLSVSTVFLSSRTEELALERRAAYEAITASGLTPIMFDAFLNRLRDADIPQSKIQHDQRKTKDRIVRDQVDVLLSQADLFVGIYRSTVGKPRDVCGGQPWLFYELYRFLTRWLVLNERELGRPLLPVAKLNDTGRADIKHAGDDVEAITSAWMRANRHELIPKLLSDALHRRDDSELSQVLVKIVETRVRLYDQPHDDRQPQLADLLAPFGETSTRTFHSHSFPFPLTDGEDRYIPAHASLFTHMHDRFTQALRDGTLRLESTQNRSTGILFRLARDQTNLHRPGVLYLLLRCCFQSGLTLEVLRVGSGENADHELQGWVVPYRDKDDVHDVLVRFRNSLRRAIRHLDSACPMETFAGPCIDPAIPCIVTVEVATIPNHSDTKSLRRTQRDSTHWQWGYRFRFVDVPGTLWNLVSLVTSYQGNITYLTYDAFFDRRDDHEKIGFDSTNRVVEFEIGIATSQPFALHRGTFEYQVKCLYGYISSTRLKSPERFSPAPTAKSNAPLDTASPDSA